jgi:hypothetical protein
VLTTRVIAQSTHIYNGINPAKLFERISTVRDPEAKSAADDSLQAYFNSYAKSNSVFRHRFTDIKYLGQVVSPDSLVKIINWNLIKGNGENYYRCYLLYRKSKKDMHVVSKMVAPYSEELPDGNYIKQQGWHGALYYDLRPFIFNSSKYYAILGIDYGNPEVTRKIIDVVNPWGSEGPVFGLPCFISGNAVKYRIIFRYSSSAVMSLKFETDTKIVFDHLSPFSQELTGNYRYYGPDFSFDSFNFEKGAWRLLEDIDIKNAETRPVRK